MTDLKSSRRAVLGAAGASFFMAGVARAATTDIFPIVETADGRLRGLVSGGVKVFKGVPYGADTSGPNRFRPPQPVKPWAGVRDALDYGQVCPQTPGDRRSDYANLIYLDIQPGGMGEDCLNLNVWTPELSRSARKPVIVRFHGGGFYGGSSNSPGMDGEMQARHGDCVVVSVNHRLSAFGFLHLADSGAPAAFAQSGMAGMLDLAAALRWVNRNIEAFGGDPSRVLIIGQSGGGAKVSGLMAMPSAAGLFHRAVQMSGAMLRVAPRERAQATADAFLKTLNLAGGDVRRLQSIPAYDLLSAQADMEAGQRLRGEAPNAFTPVLDGVAMPPPPIRPRRPGDQRRRADDRLDHARRAELPPAELRRDLGRRRKGLHAPAGRPDGRDPPDVPRRGSAGGALPHPVAGHQRHGARRQFRHGRAEGGAGPCAGLCLSVEGSEPGLGRALWRDARG
nr:carboxylesterase family protein [Phenylobacterium sp. J367]